MVFAVALLVAGAIGWWWFDRTTLRDHRLHEAEAMARCLDDVRDDVSRRLRVGGSGEARSDPRFSAVNRQSGPLSFDNHGIPLELGKDPSSVLTDWQIGGQVSVDGSPSIGSGLSSDNRFACSVVVFADGTIYVASTQVVRS